MAEKVLSIGGSITVGELAEVLNLPVTTLIGELFKNGIAATINQRIDFETATIIVEELGKEEEEVKMETTFDELDADSLDVFQVISEIEDAFDIQIETEDGLNTVGDLVVYVEEKTK